MKVNQSTLADDIFISVETLLPTCSFPTYHAHNVYEIYILNSGERNIFIGSKLYHTSPGVVAMIRPHIPHRSFGNTPYSGICVEFSKGYLDEQLSSRRTDGSVAVLYSAGYIAAGNVSEGTLVQRGESNKRKDSKERVSFEPGRNFRRVSKCN